jgi:hypothetical protein
MGCSVIEEFAYFPSPFSQLNSVYNQITIMANDR